MFAPALEGFLVVEGKSSIAFSCYISFQGFTGGGFFQKYLESLDIPNQVTQAVSLKDILAIRASTLLFWLFAPSPCYGPIADILILFPLIVFFPSTSSNLLSSLEMGTTVKSFNIHDAILCHIQAHGPQTVAYLKLVRTAFDGGL